VHSYDAGGSNGAAVVKQIAIDRHDQQQRANESESRGSFIIHLLDFWHRFVIIRVVLFARQAARPRSIVAARILMVFSSADVKRSITQA